MAPTIEDTAMAPDSLLELLKDCIPYSLPLLRRLQFSRLFRHGARPSAHILLAAYPPPSTPGTRSSQFAAAYVDMAPRPETAIWIYSSAEPPENQFSESDDELVLAILRRIRSIEAAHVDSRDPRTKLPIAKIGSLSEKVRQRLLLHGVRLDKTDAAAADSSYEICGKWLFRVDQLPSATKLPKGLVWDIAQPRDCELVRKRTSVNRSANTLLSFPSLLLRAGDGTPVAWCFLGYEGALSSLHVEETYRGQGLAKAVACRLMRDHLKDYSDDGWGCADVNLWNAQSQGLCKSIGGKKAWETSWGMLHLDTVGESL